MVYKQTWQFMFICQNEELPLNKSDFNLLLITTMKTYIDLCDAKTFDSIRNILEEYYGIRTEVLEFAFGIYGRNEETLENICYYYGIDEDELLKEAGIEDEEEDEEEDE